MEKVNKGILIDGKFTELHTIERLFNKHDGNQESVQSFEVQKDCESFTLREIVEYICEFQSDFRLDKYFSLNIRKNCAGFCIHMLNDFHYGIINLSKIKKEIFGLKTGRDFKEERQELLKKIGTVVKKWKVVFNAQSKLAEVLRNYRFDVWIKQYEPNSLELDKISDAFRELKQKYQ